MTDERKLSCLYGRLKKQTGWKEFGRTDYNFSINSTGLPAMVNVKEWGKIYIAG
jgi:hypothetical protein